MSTVPPRPAPEHDAPIAASWREYRAEAMPKDASPAEIRAARLAYYGGVSRALALVVPRINPGGVDDDADEVIAAMSAELDRFLDAYGIEDAS